MSGIQGQLFYKKAILNRLVFFKVYGTILEKLFCRKAGSGKTSLLLKIVNYLRTINNEKYSELKKYFPLPPSGILGPVELWELTNS